MSKIILADRIKELSYSVGTGDFILSGPSQGFSAFSTSYNYGDIVYYAINDGTNYEIGSGEYLFSSPNNVLRRYPFKSTNGNNKVNFVAGTKEVFVTYPGQKAVFTASNFGSFSSPQRSGVAFWGSDQILDYDSSFIWDATNNRLGINRPVPIYAIDVGGSVNNSLVRASGFIAGTSGITFSQGVIYSGGQQLEPFLRNELDVATGTNAVFALSGTVGQKILFKQQVSRTLLMGPVSGAAPNFPSFRALLVDDVPDLSSLYVRQTGVGTLNSVAIYKDPRIVGFDSFLVWDDVNNYLGVNKQVPTKSLDVVGNAEITGELLVRSGIVLQSGVPLVITNKLYSNSGQLYFNGALISAPSGAYSWILADSGVNSKVISSGNQVIVSGVFGVNTTFNTSSNVLSINGSQLSGVLRNYTDSLIALSGYNGWNLLDSGGNSKLIVKGGNVIFSGGGTVSTTFNPSTNVVLISGAAGAGYTSWTLSDSGNNTKAITNGTPVIASGSFGINPFYNTTTNVLSFSGSGLSGVLSNSISAVSGWSRSYTDALGVASGYNGWNVLDSGGNTKLIARGNNVIFSGVNNVSVNLNTSTNVVSISGNYAGGSGIIVTGNQISLSGANIIAASGFSSTAFIQTSGTFIPINNASFTMSGIYNGKTLLVSGASQINVTLSGNLPIGFGVSVIQTGPGAVFYSGIPSVIIRNRQGHTRSNGLWSVTSLVEYIDNTFVLAGDTAT
jgi:hypothetical protein